MTCGVYCLVDPGSGLVRYIGAAWNVEGKFKTICDKPWAAGVAKGWEGNRVKQWLVALFREGKRPNMQILQICNESDFDSVKRELVKIYEITGEADLNAQI